jgi:predicted component of viral defense system (DUF524 family)
LEAVEICRAVLLRPIDGGPIERLNEAALLAPARWLIHEWHQYAIEWRTASAATGEIRLEGCPSKQVGGAVIFGFQNQLGLAPLVVHAGDETVDLGLEVLSAKFATLAEHRSFYEPLVRQLSSRAATLPHSFDAPTRLRTSESARPASDLFAWHLLRQEQPKLLEAIQVVLHGPRPGLMIVDDAVDLARATPACVDDLPTILSRAEELEAVLPSSPLYALPLAAALERAGTGQRFLPRQLRAMRVEETLDTPEHRFIRWFLEDLLNTIDQLNRRRDLPEEGKQSLRDLSYSLIDALQSTFLRTVGELRSLSYASRILQRAHGYRDLFDLWQTFQHAVDPFESLQRALDVRDVATLYEWWCFYTLAEQIANEVGGTARIAVVADEAAGLPHGLRARLSDRWQLTYNPTFGKGRGRWRSYSVPLRPDFVLAHDGCPLVAFDAKFRFDRSDWDRAVGVGDDERPGAGPLAADLSPQRMAKQADIYKMHTYRDALGLRAAVILYPGRQSDRASFYEPNEEANGAGNHPFSLETLLNPDPPAGVGALPFSPEEER